jgi:hypothetical protein
MKKHLLLLVVIFVVVLMLCGAVSATSSYISSNGKTISVKNSYSTSTLKDQVSVYHTKGTYGYGYYGFVKTTGNNIKGDKVNITAVYFNKNRNYFTFNDFKYRTSKRSNPDGSYGSSYIIVTSTYKATETLNGRTFNGLKYSGKATYTFSYVNGQRLTKNAVMTAKFYNNSVLYAIVTETYVPTYKLIKGSYLGVKDTITTKTSYANGDTRTSTISSLYTRNSNGVLIGKKTSGTSSGTEIINGKKVTYTGKISIGTKYDSKDSWNEHYVYGDYSETRTSTASNLKRVIPIEAL